MTERKVRTLEKIAKEFEELDKVLMRMKEQINNEN